MGKFKATLFFLQKKYEPTKQAFWCKRILHGIAWNSGRLDYSEPSNILPRAVNGEYFAKGTEKCKILDQFSANDVAKLHDNGSPKIRDLVHEELWIGSIYPFRHKTTPHYAELQPKLFGNCRMRHLKF